MALQNVTVASSAISVLAYDDETQDCYVTFVNGRSYTLPGFPAIEFERWISAESKGGYWNMFVKGKY
jgi:hypothetical protein